MKEFILTYWIEFVFGLAITVLSFCYKHLQKKFREHEDLKEGLIAILHDRILQSGLYFIQKGEISISEFNNIEKMYKAYHKLGGNGTGTEIFGRVEELELKK